MKYTNLKIVPFSKGERDMIKKLVTRLKVERKYSEMPDVYHSLLIKGCEAFLAEEKDRN